MPIPELANIMVGEFKSFKVSKLHKRAVIIDGEDFSRHIYKHSKLPMIYGGEYLAYSVQLKQVLHEIKQCEIYPSFVFGSDCERIGFQLASQIHDVATTLKSQSLLNDTKQKNTSVPHYVFLQSVLTDVLSDMEIKFLKSPFPRILSCVSLAACLNYPIIASSPEYFLVDTHQKSSHTSSCFIPLALLRLKCLEFKESCFCESTNSKPHNVSTPCNFLTSHEFISASSHLSAVYPACRPLVGLLLGTDSLPHTKLPNYLYPIMNSIENRNCKFRRWLTLVSWFSQSSISPEAAIDEILKCYTSKERGNFLRVLTESLAAYFPNVYLGQNLSFLLHPEAAVSTQNESNPPIFVYTPQEPNSTIESDLLKKRLSNLLKGQSTIIFGSIDFTRGWPTKLMQFYLQNKLAPLILTPVYCHGGVVMPLLTENASIELSAYRISLPLRWIHYRLLSGLEHHLSQRHKLIGLKPHVLEHIRVNETLTTYQIHVDPLILNPTEDTTDAILSNVVGFLFSHLNAEMKWTVSLALTLAFWFRATTSSINSTMENEEIHSQDNDLRNSSVVLSAAAIAVTNYFNVEESDEKSVEHYGILIKFLKDQMPKQLSSVDLSIVHHFTSIHTVYNYLRSLTYLIDGLLPSGQNSNSLSFLPSYVFFPSGQLFHALVVNIESLKPEDRYRLTLRYWLPRLYRIPKLNSEFAVKLKKLAGIYKYVIDVVSEMIHSPISTPDIKYIEEPTSIPVIVAPNSRKPSNEASSITTTKTGNSLQSSNKSDFNKGSCPTTNKQSVTAPLSRQPLSELPRRCYSEKTFTNPKKHSQKVPYHLRSTGYAARLRARLEET
ncbi:Protein asteroid 1 [Schistosoma japonicum]|uniref:Protein asteroid 1 n=1 Tax=Schistosoma japonicum TaxID=6182 RepID=A0A4Z2D705_SCHJA|nr:Protein asteroid 1 [Schistosoma japonicum]TNN12277.1 Protein asteroid 1 [Schistosoma japonicum]